MAMFRRLPLILANTLLPGSGLVVVGRLISGLVGLLGALVAGAVWLMAPLVTTGVFTGKVRIWAMLCYAGLALLATAWLAFCQRPRRYDEQAVRQEFLKAATAHLRNEPGPALAAARRLVRLAPHLPGAWRLLEMMATAAGSRRWIRRGRRGAAQAADQS